MNVRNKLRIVLSIFIVIVLIAGCNKDSYIIKFTPEKGRLSIE